MHWLPSLSLSLFLALAAEQFNYTNSPAAVGANTGTFKRESSS